MSDSGGLTRDVVLRLRAQNLLTADFNAAKSALDNFTASLDKQIASANRAEISEKELGATLTKIEQITRNFTGIATMIDQFKSFETVIDRQQQSVANAASKLEAYRAKLDQTKDTTASSARTLASLVTSFERQEAALAKSQERYRELGEALHKAGVDINNLVSVENELKQAADQAGAAITKLSDAKLNYAENTRKAREEAKALAETQRQEAAIARQAAAEYAASVKQQEQAQYEAFKAFKAVEDARAQGHAKSVADVQAGVEAYRREQAAAAAAAKAAADARIAEEKRITEQKAEEARKRAAIADREIRDRINALIQQKRQEAGLTTTTTTPAPTPIPGAPRTDALGRPGRGASGAVGLLGLRPYELTNLGYQINDVVTGLISGQNAMQVFAQQGGQFLQIFGTAALRWLGPVALAVGAVTVAIGALNSHLRELASNREFEAALSANARAIDQNAQSLTELRHSIRDMAVSWSDAGKVIQQAIAANITPELREQFAQLAKDISRVGGVDVPAAMADLVKGLTGGRTALEDFISKYPVLTDAQYKHIRALLDENKVQEAQNEVLDIAVRRYRAAAENGTSPLTKATEALSRSWDHLLDTIGKSTVFDTLVTSLTTVVGLLDSAVKKADELAHWFSDSGWASTLGTLVKYSPAGLAVQGAVAGYNYMFPGAPAPAGGGDRFTTGNLKIDTESLKQLAGYIGEAAKTLPPGYRVEAISTERPGATVRGTGVPSEHSVGRAIDVRIVDQNGVPVPGSMGAGGPLYTQLDAAIKAIAEKAGVPVAIGSQFSRADAGHYSIGGPEAARQTGTQTAQTQAQDIAQDRIIKQQREANEQQRAASEAAELALVRRQALEKALNEGRDEERAKQYADEVVENRRYQLQVERYKRENDARKQRIQDGAEADRIESAGERKRQEAIKQGITDYKSLRDIQNEGRAEERAQVQRERSDKDALLAIEKQLAGLQRGNAQKDATELSKALEAVRLQYQGIYESLERLRGRQSTLSKEVLDQKKAEIDAAKQVAEREATIESFRKAADTALKTRNELVQTYQNLLDRGDISISEQQQKTKEAFELTAPAIKKAADELEAYLKTAEGLKESPLRVAEMTAKIKDLRSQLQYVDPFMKGLRKTIEDSFSTNAARAFDTVGEAIGGLIAKTKSWSDVLKSVKQAGIDLFASLLKDIANYILKAELAKVASSLFTSGSSSDSGTSIGGIFAKVLGFGSAMLGGGPGGMLPETGSTGAILGDFSPRPGVFHAGGVVGRDTVPTRAVPVYWFEHAPRYHTGTVVGMGPNEQAAVLQRGEEVLSRNNPRNILNLTSGGGSGANVNIRSVLVADPSYVPTAMSGAQGEKIVVQHLVKNAATVRQLMKG